MHQGDIAPRRSARIRIRRVYGLAIGCDLQFRHEGLSPRLECYEMCRAGWDQYLPSLRDYVETGTGNPYTAARLG